MHRTLPHRPSSPARTAPPALPSPVLARSTPQELADARDRARELLGAARALAVASNHDPDVADCIAAECGLPRWDGSGALCSVVHRLALLAPDGPGAARDIDEAYRRFVTACTAGIEAIRVCRQTAHPSGYCWFSAAAEHDGCRDVLRLTHRLG